MSEHRAARAPRAGRRRAERPSHWRRLTSVPVRLALSAGVLLGGGAIGTFAYWTDSATVTSGSLTAGTMDLQFDTSGAVGLNTGYAKTDLTWSGFIPGDTKAFDLKVSNVGNAKFTYNAQVAQGSTWTFTDNPVVVQLYSGAVSGGACTGTALGSAQTVSTTGQAVFTTDQTLLAGTSSSLCLKLTFATGAAVTDQGKSGTLAFAFTANQS